MTGTGVMIGVVEDVDCLFVLLRHSLWLSVASDLTMAAAQLLQKPAGRREHH